RYTMELAGEAHGGRGRDVAALKAAQDMLGRLHDLERLIARVRDEQVRLSPPAIGAWRDFGSLAHALEDDCRALHARYMPQRAKLLAIADRAARAASPDAVDASLAV